MTFWYILRIFGTFSGFGFMHLEKSGNPLTSIAFPNPNFKQTNIGHQQGCQMVYFQTKNPNLGIYQMDLQWLLEYFTAI
jgi:hypothetical protein